MQRKFLVNLGFLLLLNLLVKPFYLFGIDAQIQNQLGDSYGNYFALLNLSFLFNIVLDFGVNNFNTRQISRHPDLAQKNIVRITNLRASLFVLYVVITLATAFFTEYSSSDFIILGLLVFNQFLVGMNQYFSSNFKGLHQFKRDAIMSVLDRVLLIIFCSLLLWGNFSSFKLNILYFVLAQTLAYGISFTVGGVLTLMNGVDNRRKWSWQFNRQIIRKSLPYAFLILLMMMYSRIDSIMLERMVGDHSASEYAQGYRILDAFNMFALLFASLLLPIFARLIKQNLELLSTIQLASKTLIFLGITASICVFFFGKTFLETVYNHVSDQSSLSFNYLIFGFLGMTFTYVFGTLLTANGSLKQLNILAFISVILNVVLNLILIPKLEVVGAALATCITQLFMGLAQLILAQYIFKLRVNVSLILKFTALAVGCFSIGFLLIYLEWMKDWYMILTYGVFALLFGLVFRIIEPKAVLKILKEKE